MTFYPSESVIKELAQQAREAAAAIADKARRNMRDNHPEEYNAPLEYQMGREECRVYCRLTRAYAGAEDTHRPAAERYDELKHALRIWKAAGGNQQTFL